MFHAARSAFLPFTDSWGCPGETGSRCTENPLVDSLYFSVVTLTTVGYGDIVPKQPWAKGFVCAYIIFGLTGVMYALSAAANHLLTKQHSVLIPPRLGRAGTVPWAHNVYSSMMFATIL